MVLFAGNKKTHPVKEMRKKLNFNVVSRELFYLFKILVNSS
jgi:hypothetical protein